MLLPENRQEGMLRPIRSFGVARGKGSDCLPFFLGTKVLERIWPISE